MKLLPQFAALLLAASPLLGADGDPAYKIERSNEIFSSKVIRVYSFKEADAEYVACVVTWKGHEVVAVPLVPGTVEADTYKVGDPIRCQMILRPAIDGKAGPASLSCVIEPQLKQADADAELRLEAFRAEVQRRREQRVILSHEAKPQAAVEKPADAAPAQQATPAPAPATESRH